MSGWLLVWMAAVVLEFVVIKEKTKLEDVVVGKIMLVLVMS